MPIRVDLGWVAVFTIIATSVTVVPQLHAWSPWFGCVLALGMTASIAIHECSHVVVARRVKVHVEGMRLHFLGATASLGRSSSPSQEILVAIVGPFVSFILTAAFVFVALHARTTSNADLLSNPVSALCGLLGIGNAAITGWNLLPIFPLDGRRVAHGLLWKLTGDAVRAARISSTITIVACAAGALALGALHLGAIATFRYAALLSFLIFQGGFMAPREFAKEAAPAQRVDG